MLVSVNSNIWYSENAQYISERIWSKLIQEEPEHPVVYIRGGLLKSKRHNFHLDGKIAFRSTKVINLMFTNTLFLLYFPFERYFSFNRQIACSDVK